MANNFYKPISSAVNTRQEVPSLWNLGTIATSAITYTLIDRTVYSAETNYVQSFNLPYQSSAFETGSTLSLSNPSLQQLNVDKAIIVPIPRDYYDEIIDGRSITLNIPQYSGATDMSAKTIVSSTYSSLQKKQSSPLVGDNVAFLFCDEINLPYNGTTNDGAVTHTASSWNASPFTQRPAAVAYSELGAADINTDSRDWSSVTLANTSISESYPTNTNQGYNYDIPVGFAALNKGFLIITHPDIVDNFPWGEGKELYTNNANTSSGTTDIYIDDNSVSNLSYYSIGINYKTSVVCIALPSEFFLTNNPTWNLQANLQELQNGTNGFDSIYITEIGLYNINKELIAVAKLDRPVEKTYTSLLTFNLDIDV
jgi:hypothetical protein